MEQQNNKLLHSYSLNFLEERETMTRKSTSGYVFQIGTSTISWKSKLQSIVALSSTKAEYVLLSIATQEAVWLRVLLDDMGFKQDNAITIFEDNQGAIALAKNPTHHSRTKHIDIKYHYVCLLYTSPSPRDGLLSRMPSSA